MLEVFRKCPLTLFYTHPACEHARACAGCENYPNGQNCCCCPFPCTAAKLFVKKTAKDHERAFPGNSPNVERLRHYERAAQHFEIIAATSTGASAVISSR